MPVIVEATAPDVLTDADLTPRGPVQPSPADWRDQVLYFLLPDRFSDGAEAQRPLFDRTQPQAFATSNPSAWAAAGTSFQGGTIGGIRSKLEYLQGLGVTALWLGPVWRQRADLDTYHGYGIQHFLEIDPRFGTRQDLRDLVDAAHARGMYVLLDIIYNHSGNNWFYDVEGQPRTTAPYQYSPPRAVHSWRSASGVSTAAITGAGDGVWPREFQTLEWYTRAGQIGRWDPEPWENPLHPDTEFRRGDFFDLKDLDLTRNEVLSAVIRVYQYWIALTDCDGFRIDTVKHVPWEASRHFCGAMREYAESIGKGHFLLLGEVTGGDDMARNYLEIFGRNIDAVLDIGAPASRLAGMVKGLSSPSAFFDQFHHHDVLGSHRETGRYHVSILDDHDMVGRDKARFASGNAVQARYEQVAHAVGTQLTTLGMPCVYYGTEQAFDGRHLGQFGSGFEDRFIRESMFGGTFGAFGTDGCHFFDADHPSYLRIAAIARVRARPDAIGMALRRGRQYARETAPGQSETFALPGAGGLIAWSRILHHQEVLVVLNTNGAQGGNARVTVDASLHPDGRQLRVLYRSDWNDAELTGTPPAAFAPVHHLHGRATVRVDLPPAGMAVLA